MTMWSADGAAESVPLAQVAGLLGVDEEALVRKVSRNTKSDSERVIRKAFFCFPLAERRSLRSQRLVRVRARPPLENEGFYKKNW